MRVLISFLFAASLFGATAKDPASCSSRPCTYTITCASSTCTTGEVDEIQTAIDDVLANSTGGDTIKLEAGRTWTLANNEILFDEWAGWDGSTGQYLTITTTKDDELPPRGVRITPHYQTIMPRLLNECNSAQYCIGLTGDATPTEHIRFRGLWFEANGATSVGQLTLGNRKDDYGYTITTYTEQPDDIRVDHCVFWPLMPAGSIDHIWTPSREVWIEDSWMGDNRRIGANETMCLNARDGVGPIHWINNYCVDGTENVFFGGQGTGSAGLDVAFELELAHSVLEKEPRRSMTQPWEAGLEVFEGKIVRESDNSNYYQAQDGGTTDSGEPTWPGSGTVVDNDITWLKVGQDYTIKNHLECKACKGWRVYNNTFQGMWRQNQSGSIVINPFALVANGSGWPRIPNRAGTVDTNGTAVTWVSGDNLPMPWKAKDEDGVDLSEIIINGTPYQVADFDLEDVNSLTLTGTAGSQTGVAYTHGDPDDQVFRAWARDLHFSNNYFRNIAQVLSNGFKNNVPYTNLGYIVIDNNLIESANCDSYGRGCGAGGTGSFYFNSQEGGHRFTNNTCLECSGAESALYWNNYADANFPFCSEYTLNECPDRSVVRDSLIARSQESETFALRGRAIGGEGQDMLNTIVTGNSGVDASTVKFDNMILAGIEIDVQYPGPADVHSLCSDTSTTCTPDWEYDDPVYGVLFQDYTGGDYSVRSGHYAFNSGIDGRSWGADPNKLSRISDIVVAPTTTTALISWRVSPPESRRSCSVAVSTDPDPMQEGSYVTDLDPDTYTDPGVVDPDVNDWLARSVTIGSNAALTTATTYHYWLHCGGGYETGSFTTQ